MPGTSKPRPRRKHSPAIGGKSSRPCAAVPGAETLQFDFNPASGWMGFDPEAAWPGDEYVDYVGPDIYDDAYAKDTYPWPQDATDEEIDQRKKPGRPLSTARMA